MILRFASIAALVAFGLLALHAAALPGEASTQSDEARFCAGRLGPDVQRYNAGDSEALATAWLPALEHLTAAIPSLSPHEEQWLLEETKAPTIERQMRAEKSREHSIHEAGTDTHALQQILRGIVAERDRAALTCKWLQFIWELMELDAPYHLVRLVADNAVPKEAIPGSWRGFDPKEDFDALQRSIAWGRARLAREIIECTLSSIGATKILGAPLGQ